MKFYACFVLVLIALLALASCGEGVDTASSDAVGSSSAISESSDVSEESSDVSEESPNASEESSNASEESSNASEESSDVSEESSDASEESSTENPEGSVDETISLELLEDETEIANAVKFVDEKSMNNDWHIKITLPETAVEFQFLALNGDFEPTSYDSVDKRYIDEALFTYGEIDAGTPILIDTYINDIVANRGFCYTNAHGQTAYYVIVCDVTGMRDEPIYLESFIIK